MVPTVRPPRWRQRRVTDGRTAWLLKAVLTDTVSASSSMRPTHVSSEPDQEFVVSVSPLELLMRVIDRSWRVVGRLARGHAAIYRVTGGRLGQHVAGVPPTLLLDHVGAKSGTLRTTPLVYMPDGNRLVVVAAKGGAPHEPGLVLQPACEPTRQRPDRYPPLRGARQPD